MHRDDDILGHVGELSRQIARVGGLECRIGQSLAGTVGGTEILKDSQSLAEIRLDGRFNDLSRRLRHQAAHPSQLADLLHAASGTRVSHQIDRVDVSVGAAVARGVLLKGRHHVLGDLFAGVRPGVENGVVTLAVGDHALLVPLEDLENFLVGFANNLRFADGSDEIVGRERQAALGAPLEASAVHVVEEVDRPPTSERLVAIGDHAGQFARAHGNVVEEHPFRQH